MIWGRQNVFSKKVFHGWLKKGRGGGKGGGWDWKGANLTNLWCPASWYIDSPYISSPIFLRFLSVFTPFHPHIISPAVSLYLLCFLLPSSSSGPFLLPSSSSGPFLLPSSSSSPFLLPSSSSGPFLLSSSASSPFLLSSSSSGPFLLSSSASSPFLLSSSASSPSLLPSSSSNPSFYPPTLLFLIFYLPFHFFSHFSFSSIFPLLLMVTLSTSLHFFCQTYEYSGLEFIL